MHVRCRSLFLFYCSTLHDRCSVGKTMAGKMFMNTHKDWDGSIRNPLKEFLCLRHRKLYLFFFWYNPQLIWHLAIEERLYRASLWAEKSQSHHDSPTNPAPQALAPQSPTMPTSEVPPISGIQPMPASPTHVPSPDVVPSSNFITASQQVANEVSTINVQAHSVTPSADSVAHHSPQVTTSENIAAPNSQAFFIPQTTLNSSLTLNQTQAPSLIQQWGPLWKLIFQKWLIIPG